MAIEEFCCKLYKPVEFLVMSNEMPGHVWHMSDGNDEVAISRLNTEHSMVD